MSLEDYQLSKKLNAEVDDDNYYALIMAAMRGADSKNIDMLCRCWPEVWHELEARYAAPGGLLPGELLHLATGGSGEPYQNWCDGMDGPNTEYANRVTCLACRGKVKV